MANDDRPLDREIRIARVFRLLGTKPMTRSQAEMAGKLLGLHWTSVYRLRRRFLGDPVASSVAPMLRGPRPGDKRVAAPVEQIIADVSRGRPRRANLRLSQLACLLVARRDRGSFMSQLGGANIKSGRRCGCWGCLAPTVARPSSPRSDYPVL